MEETIHWLKRMSKLEVVGWYGAWVCTVLGVVIFALALSIAFGDQMRTSLILTERAFKRVDQLTDSIKSFNSIAHQIAQAQIDIQADIHAISLNLDGINEILKKRR